MASDGFPAGRVAPRPGEAPFRLPARAKPIPLALRRAELALTSQERQIGSRPTRVPLDAFVPIDAPRRLLPPTQTLRLPPPPPASSPDAGAAVTDDRAERAATPRWTRVILREVAVLALLAATLALTYYAGRLNAAQNVIIVPGPSSHRSVVT